MGEVLPKIKEFTPTQSQQRYLQVFLNQTNENCKQDLCREADIDFSTLWKWEQNPAFREWIQKKVDEATNRYTPGIKLKIFEKALQPKATVQERELALKIANEYVPTSKHILENTDYETEINKILKKAKELVE